MLASVTAHVRKLSRFLVMNLFVIDGQILPAFSQQNSSNRLHDLLKLRAQSNIYFTEYDMFFFI